MKKIQPVLITTIIIIILQIALESYALSNSSEYYIVSVSPDETMVAVVATDFTFEILDAMNGNLLFNLPNLPVRPFSVVWNPQSTKIAAAGGDEIIRVWCTDIGNNPECNPGTFDREITGHYGPLLALAWNNDGRLASVGQGESQNFKIWDSNNNFQMIASSVFSANQLTWHPTQHQLAVAIEDSGVYILSGEFKMNSAASEVTNVSALSVAWNSDGSKLAFGSENGYVYVVDPVSKITIAEFTGHTSEVYTLHWSPDNTKVASAERRGQVIVSDIASEESYLISNDKDATSNLSIDWTAATGLVFASDTGIVGLGANIPPTAQAGNDQSRVDHDDKGFQSIILDGSRSTDDVIITDYMWSEDGVEIARGLNPELNLSVSTHTITLTVIDDDGSKDTDEVIITVSSPDA